MKNVNSMNSIIIKFIDYGERIHENIQKLKDKRFYKKEPDKPTADGCTHFAAELFICLLDDKLKWVKNNGLRGNIEHLVCTDLRLNTYLHKDQDDFEIAVFGEVADELDEILSWWVKDRIWHRFDVIKQKTRRYIHTLKITDLGDHRILWYHEQQETNVRTIVDCVNEAPYENECFDLVNSFISYHSRST